MPFLFNPRILVPKKIKQSTVLDMTRFETFCFNKRPVYLPAFIHGMYEKEKFPACV